MTRAGRADLEKRNFQNLQWPDGIKSGRGGDPCCRKGPLPHLEGAGQTGLGSMPCRRAPAAYRNPHSPTTANDCQSTETVPPAVNFFHTINLPPPPALLVRSIPGRKI
ncbi:hypothetical protein [Mesorhizobium sp. IMUNJ 23232]|uniref:hypothetical protein n=1 Tax=Mesorhizobium sp. IMUNJ 23232 TaxID=3376064 RepID=UPI0037A106B9